LVPWFLLPQRGTQLLISPCILYFWTTSLRTHKYRSCILQMLPCHKKISDNALPVLPHSHASTSNLIPSRLNPSIHYSNSDLIFRFRFIVLASPYSCLTKTPLSYSYPPMSRRTCQTEQSHHVHKANPSLFPCCHTNPINTQTRSSPSTKKTAWLQHSALTPLFHFLIGSHKRLVYIFIST
jgi:hypothetical protein